MNKELTLEEAENIVDNMYQNRWKECGVEDGNTIHMGNLSNLKYNELESASILLLRTEIRLKREIKKLQQENQSLKKQLEEANEKILLLKASKPMLEYKKTLEENQQKEFIKYLEDEFTKIQNDIEKEIDNNVKYFKVERRQAIAKILQKYKEIIRNNND